MWSKIYIGHHVKYPLFWPDFNETWMFWTEFRNNTQISNFKKIRPVGAEMVHAGHDEAKKLFSQFYEPA
jgi:hypothetical protein